MAHLKAEINPKQLRRVKEKNIPKTNFRAPYSQEMMRKLAPALRGYLKLGGLTRLGNPGVWSRENMGLAFPEGFLGWRLYERV